MGPAAPVAQTRDLVPLPGGYGMGSSTLARWIGQHTKLKEGGGAQLGETCEGLNEMTGKQFPACRTQFEAWCSMQSATEDGLGPAPAAERRCTVVPILQATEGMASELIMM